MVGTTSGIIISRDGEDHNIKIFQGKTIELILIWGGSTPIDVSDFDARMQIKRSSESSNKIAEFTVGNGRVDIGTTNGRIVFSMNATDSAALPPGVYVYDIEVIDDTDKVIQALSGRATIIGEVTK